MQLTIDEVTIEGDMAVVSGRGSLTFVTTTEGVDSAPRSQRSWHVNCTAPSGGRAMAHLAPHVGRHPRLRLRGRPPEYTADIQTVGSGRCTA